MVLLGFPVSNCDTYLAIWCQKYFILHILMIFNDSRVNPNSQPNNYQGWSDLTPSPPRMESEKNRPHGIGLNLLRKSYDEGFFAGKSAKSKLPFSQNLMEKPLINTIGTHMALKMPFQKILIAFQLKMLLKLTFILNFGRGLGVKAPPHVHPI